MNTPPNNTATKSSLHPLIIAAAVAVIFVCAIGSAALLGWLPASIGSNHATPAEASASASASSASTSDPRHQSAATTAAAPPRVCANCGVIESVNVINTRAEGSGIGAAGGAVVGGLLGNQVGGGTGRSVATIVGAIGGAVAGNQIEGNVNATRSYAIRVRLDNGNTRTLHQSTAPRWGAGERVTIVDGVLHAG